MNEKEYLEPDYTGYPREDDDDDILEEVDEGDVEVEKLLDEQEALDKKIERDEEQKNEYFRRKEESLAMSNNTPFGSTSTPSWANGGTSGNTVKPWERNQTQQNSGPSWRSPSWGGNGGSSSWGGGSSWSPTTTQRETTPPQSVINIRKKVVICDILDCLYESWESNGCPNKMPRAIFDLMPKFQVWDRIASFAPQKVYLIFPAPELLPSFGNRQSSEITLEYIAQCVSTYLRIPRRCCIILKQMQDGLPKEKTLMGAIKDWKRVEDMVYIGIHSGRFGLSSRDADAAHQCGIDYMDLFNLLDGKYEYE